MNTPNSKFKPHKLATMVDHDGTAAYNAPWGRFNVAKKEQGTNYRLRVESPVISESSLTYSKVMYNAPFILAVVAVLFAGLAYTTSAGAWLLIGTVVFGILALLVGMDAGRRSRLPRVIEYTEGRTGITGDKGAFWEAAEVADRLNAGQKFSMSYYTDWQDLYRRAGE